MYRRVMMCQSSEGRITNYNPDRETKRKAKLGVTDVTMMFISWAMKMEEYNKTPGEIGPGQGSYI